MVGRGKQTKAVIEFCSINIFSVSVDKYLMPVLHLPLSRVLADSHLPVHPVHLL